MCVFYNLDTSSTNYQQHYNDKNNLMASLLNFYHPQPPLPFRRLF